MSSHTYKQNGASIKAMTPDEMALEVKVMDGEVSIKALENGVKSLPNDKAEGDEENQLKESDDPKWSDLSGGEQCRRVVVTVLKFVGLLGCLYFFICSLGFLEYSFQLLGGQTAGATFRNNEVLNNPFAGLMIGVLATVLVQSSSTSTSIVVALVGAKVIPVKIAIPIVMGANIGTSVTNTLVSMAQMGDREEFRRAFGGATVHDMFNWMTVFILLPLEIGTHYLFHLTEAIVHSLHLTGGYQKQDLLKKLTKPFTKLVVEIDDEVIINSAIANSTEEEAGTLKRWCQTAVVQRNVTRTMTETLQLDCGNVTLDTDPRFYGVCSSVAGAAMADGTFPVELSWNSTSLENVTENIQRCSNLFAQSDLSDSAVGAILLVCSLVIILVALFLIVKLLHSMLEGSVAKVIKKTINSDFPGKLAFLTGYLAILVGCGMTMIIQSSSIFTSTLTPMVGVGVVTVERMYPMTLGSNIGTTLTAILAALSASGNRLGDSLQIALCHLFFNLSGVLIFYPIPFMRIPISFAKVLGNVTANYRWFAVFYLVLTFLVVPGGVFGLSYAGPVYLAAIGGPVLFIFVVAIIINALQRRRPGVLPRKLRNWDFLPEFMHSLAPMDRVISAVFRCQCCRSSQAPEDEAPMVTSSSEALVREGIVNTAVVTGDVETQRL